ncbi:MFS transporter [Leucobacter salsicius]|uniref:MFS transporter n=1 Tax=Leucobacter salsicius TaxID=664638 RepID=UPI00034D3378|nr:MFS transporter [Leucobacter salsicius]
MSEPVGRILLRFAPAIYGPTALFAVGEGAILPILPVLATRLGADVALATLIAAMLVIGQLIGNLPAGWAVARFGERRSMAVSGVVALAGATGAALAPTLFLLGVATLVIGLSAAVFGLARHAFLTIHVPAAMRARALAVLAGTFRFGTFTGPFIAAGLLAATGSPAAAAWFFAACLVLTVALVVVAREPEMPARAASVPSAAGDPDHKPHSTAPRERDAEQTGVFATMVRHRGVLARLGLSAATLAALRSARQVLIPVWGIAIGADPGTIALVTGISGACDFALFYASGQITDRFGRLWATTPAMLLMSVGLIVLTLGADLAPRGNPAPFFGSWHTISDAGGAAAPLIIAGIAAVSLPAASAVMGVLGLLGAAGFLRWMPRYVPRKR